MIYKSIVENANKVNNKIVKSSDGVYVNVDTTTGCFEPLVLKDNDNWRTKKLNSRLLSESYERLGNKKAQRVHECGNFLEFKRYVDGVRKLNVANFCKVRLCQMCSWRRSLKVFAQTSKVMDYAIKKDDSRFIFLTLTAKNVYGEDLSAELDTFFKAFDRLFKRKAVKQSVKGYFRALEVTHNLKEDTYNPHFHVILQVNKSYFSDKRYYISHKEWVSMWKQSLQIDYFPSVDIRAVKDLSKEGQAKAVAEVAKYSVKDSDLIVKDEQDEVDDYETDKVVHTLDEALARRRLLSYGGKLKEYHKELNLDDVEDGSLVHVDTDELNDELAFVLERYSWRYGYSNYVLVNVREPEEQ